MKDDSLSVIDVTDVSYKTFSYESSLRPGEVHHDGEIIEIHGVVIVRMWNGENVHTIMNGGSSNGHEFFTLNSVSPDQIRQDFEVWTCQVAPFDLQKHQEFRFDSILGIARKVGRLTTDDSQKRLANLLLKYFEI